MIKSGLHGIGLWENTAGEVPRRGIYMQRRIAVVTVIFLCVLSLLTGGEKCVAYAEEGAAGNGLSGDVEVLRQDGLNYVMQVTVENSGEDFYGTVQVVFVSGYGMAIARMIRRSPFRPRERNNLPPMWHGGRWRL